jgi:hypothetical protein
MEQNPIEQSKNTLLTLVNEVTAHGKLILTSVNAINFLVSKANEAESLSKSNQILSQKVQELETLLAEKK